MLHVHVAVLKEPRGFIKILQFVLAILAYATTVGVSTFFTFHASLKGCKDNTGLSQFVRKDVTYPFSLDAAVVKQKLCNDPPQEETFHFSTDESPAAKFFVAIGVVCMIYSLAALVVYVLFSDGYKNRRLLPTLDFGIHAILAFLWLVAGFAWVHGTVNLKSGCNPQDWLHAECDARPNVACVFTETDSSGSFGKLNASLLFGFLNAFLWTANLWFLWKETPWFKARPDAASPEAPIG